MPDNHVYAKNLKRVHGSSLYSWFLFLLHCLLSGTIFVNEVCVVNAQKQTFQQSLKRMLDEKTNSGTHSFSSSCIPLTLLFSFLWSLKFQARTRQI
jgi:hypothetical protein